MTSGKSFIRVDVDTGEIGAVLASIRKTFGAGSMKAFNQAGAEVAKDEIEGYYLQKGRNLWINPALPTHGPGRQKTRFSDNVATGWGITSVTGSGANIANKAVGLAHKVTGGTISAKSAKFLTIPIIPEAHGRKARKGTSSFVSNIGPLFASKGCLMWKKPDGTILPAYALKKSVTHKPWPGALPPDETITDAFLKGVQESIDQQLNKD
jgi:hypothetical protein